MSLVHFAEQYAPDLIDLALKLEAFDGVIIGSSAGPQKAGCTRATPAPRHPGRHRTQANPANGSPSTALTIASGGIKARSTG